MQAAAIYIHGKKAGMLIEDENGYHFSYEPDYLLNEYAEAVSLTLPLRKEPYHSSNLFPFFDGLIPEGWLLHLAEKNWKLNQRDRMGLLLVCCEDCIGAVSVRPINEGGHNE